MKYRIISFIGLTIALAALISYVTINTIFKFTRCSQRPALIDPSILPISTFTLKNGLTCISYKISSPTVIVQIAYRVGSANEEFHQTGIAHAIEHMLFKGTNKLSESDIPTITRKFGAQTNAYTTKDTTCYFFEVPKNNWEVFVGIFADCMSNAQFDKEHLASELKTILQELERTNSNEKKYSYSLLYQLNYPGNHPYHHPVIGYKDDVFSLSTQTLQTFYKKYYYPNNATLFIIGDIDHDEVQKKVTYHFGSIPPAPSIPTIQFPRKESSNLQTSITTLFRLIKKPTITWFWKLPLNNPKNSVLLSAAALLLSGMPQHPLATKFSATSLKTNKDGILMVSSHASEHSIDQINTAFKQKLKKIIRLGFTEKELALVAAKKHMDFINRQEHLQQFALHWMKSYNATNDPLYYFTEPNTYQALTPQEMQTFFATYCDPSMANQLILKPIPEHLQNNYQHEKQAHDQEDQRKTEQLIRTTPQEKPLFAHQTSTPQAITYTPPIPDIVTTLPNGLTLIVKHNPKTTTMHLSCQFNNTHYLARTVEKEPLNFLVKALFKKSNLSNFFKEHNATLECNHTGVSITIFNSAYQKVLKQFFSMLLEPHFDSKSIATYKKKYLTAIKRKKKNKASLLFKKIIYHNHPFGWTWDDAATKIKSITMDLLKIMYSNYVRPNNMTISITGNIDTKTITSFITQQTAHWKPAKTTLHLAPLPKFVYNPQHIHYTKKSIQSALLLGSPSEVGPTHDDYLPLQLLNFICFSSLGSRIYDLRETMGLFYYATGSWAKRTIAPPGYNFIKLSTSPYNTAIAQQEILTMIDSIGQAGVTEHELAQAKLWFMQQVMNKFSTSTQTAKTFSLLSTTKLGFSYYHNLLNKLEILTLEQMNGVCKRYCNTKNFSILCVGPISKKKK